MTQKDQNQLSIPQCWPRNRLKPVQNSQSCPGAGGRHRDEKPGFGRSSNFGICSLDMSAKDLIPLVNDHIYKKIELVGSSPNGIEDAVHNAISRASKTIRNMSWFEVAEVRGHLENNKVAHWQVTVKVGFTLEN
jgi:flavin-binding protein dodecin